jgi:hypothetical protein
METVPDLTREIYRIRHFGGFRSPAKTVLYSSKPSCLDTTWAEHSIFTVRLPPRLKENLSDRNSYDNS